TVSSATSFARTTLRPPAPLTDFTRLKWADTFTRELPGDPELPEAPYSVLERQSSDDKESVPVPEALLRASRQVRGALWSWAVPESHEAPRLAGVSSSGARLLGLDSHAFWRDATTAAEAWSGNLRLPGSNSWAANYGGHQFGVWAGQLGDGRAMSLGEVLHNSQRWEIQLKGAGRTPYARFADGYAVRRSSIREYLAAEHLHALGIPTARSLALVFTDRVVEREQPERGAVLSRLAPSWVRFGSFELPASRGDLELTRQLADYVVHHHFAEFADADSVYMRLLERVCNLTARMVARWQAAGFCHGVMNTDNMSILGLTIDYGPFAFLDAYDPAFICNHSDPAGRYAFDEQPRVALWNLMRLAAPLAALVDGAAEPGPKTVRMITDALNQFGPEFRREYLQVMRRRFGLFADHRDDDLEAVIQPYLDLLQEAKTDYIFAMRTLCSVPETLGNHDKLTALAARLAERSLNVACRDTSEWQHRMCNYLESVYTPRLQAQSIAPAELATRMKQENPTFVLRNWVAQDVIERAERGDVAWIDKVLDLLTTHAFDDHAPSGMEDAEKYAGPVPEWGEGLQCSCSS
ncbi:hypothetical protein IWW55_001779, partial [Coemansia sp. RSA 2706]